MIAFVAGLVRLRSVDTNPVMLPSRYWATDPMGSRATDADRFAKHATVVTELYSMYLESGPALPARTSWARLIPNNSRGARRFDGIPATQELGLGEVHEVPFDPNVLRLPDDRRRRALLDWLHDNMLALADSLNWNAGPLEAARNACLRADCQFVGAGETKSDRRRAHKAHIQYEIDGNGDAWTWAIVANGDGDQVAASERYDGFPARTYLRRASRTLRWDGPTLTWTSCASEVVPARHKDLARTQRLTLP